MKRVLIIGVSSFVGSNIAYYLRDQYRVFGTYGFNPPKIDGVVTLPFLLTAQAPIADLVKVIQPEVVVYCAAVVDEQKCLKEISSSLYVNTEAPVTFARTMFERGGRMIFLSTSKVFSGERGNYSESDLTDPQGPYGVSKRQAEDQLLIFSNTSVLRLGTVYGLGAYHQPSALMNRMLSQLWLKKDTQFISDEKRSFVSAEDVAKAVSLTIDSSPDKVGLYHLAASDKDSYFSFAKTLGTVMGLKTDHFHPINGADFRGSEALSGGARGKDLSLDGSLFFENFHFQFRNVLDALFSLRQVLHTGNQ